uniref:Uncharacterized protein n=1 Tax=Ochrobactrum phage ORM_20 TaxID=2985243 RepID=A0A9N6WTS1_9VIRU|nr:hypothetical protein ORM20_00169 [Ochrobactrum phage ORM_20]
MQEISIETLRFRILKDIEEKGKAIVNVNTDRLARSLREMEDLGIITIEIMRLRNKSVWVLRRK